MFAERWKVISEHRNYLVSDQGRVMNAKTARILKPRPNFRNYLRVRLGKNSREHSVQTYVSNPAFAAVRLLTALVLEMALDGLLAL